MQFLDEALQGASKMEQVTRTNLCCPRLDDEIENVVYPFEVCVLAQQMPPAYVSVNWPETEEKGACLHLDFAGPLKG